MKKRFLGIFLAASLVVSGLQAPGIAYASEVEGHEEHIAVASAAVSCNLVEEGSVSNPEFIVERGRDTLVPDQAGALAYYLNNLAQSGDRVTLSAGNVELVANATIKAGVTVVIPYASGKISTNADKNDGTASETAYSTLTVKEGVVLRIQGEVQVTAESGKTSGGSLQNVITGGWGLIQTETGSMIEVCDGALLEVYGNIKGAGSIIARSGAKVIDRIIITSYQGGNTLLADLGLNLGDSKMEMMMNIASGMKGEEKEYAYPLNYTGCSGIEVKAQYDKGSFLYGKTKIYASLAGIVEGWYGEPFLLIGEESETVTGLYVHGEDASSYIVREVREAGATDNVLDKETIRFVNGGRLAASQLVVTVSNVTVNVTTENFVYPVGAQTNIEFTNELNAGSTFYVDRAFKFLKGSSLTIGQGAKLVLDEAAFNGTFSASTKGSTEGDPTTGFLVFYDGAKLNINGELRLEQEGTLAISEGQVTLGTNGKISMPCTHDSKSEVTTTEKSGAVTVTTNWSNLVVAYDHGEGKVEQYDDGHIVDCDSCDVPFEKQEHEFTMVEIPVSCEVDGEKVYTCTVCGYVKKELVQEKYGHNIEGVVPVPQGDEHVWICTNYGCGQVVERTEHDWRGEYLEPTYTESGYDYRKCDTCGEDRNTLLDPKPDNIVPVVKFELGATPIKVLNDIINLFKDNVSVRIEAEDNETGLKSLEYYVSEKELSEVEVSTLTGWTTYTKALECTEERDYFIYVKATDNSGNVAIHGVEGSTLELIVAIDRTAADFTGLYFDKVNCGETTVTIIDRYIDPENVYVNGEKVAVSSDGTFVLQPSVEPYTIKAIDHVGNESVIENIIVNTGHDYTEWEITESEHRRSCKTCGEVFEAEHNYPPKYDTIQEQSCDRDAISVRYCQDCGKEDRQTLAAFGHNWRETEKVEATARQDGYVKKVCRNCRMEDVEVLPALNGGGSTGNGGTSNGGTGNSPTTNDGANVFMWTSLGLAALVVIYATRKKFG